MNALKTLGKTLALVAGLAPVAASAHCCCDRDHHRVVSRDDDWSYVSRHHDVREDIADLAAASHHTCRNYPASADRVGATGTTWVRIRVADDGWVVASRVSRSSGRSDLDRAALACVANWHFRHGYDWQAVKITWHASWGHSWSS